MIPSKYSIVEAYRKEGRLNAKAVYRLMHVTEEEARRRHADVYDEFIVDACMFADEWLPSFFKNGASEEDVHLCISRALMSAHWYHRHGSSTDERHDVRMYLSQCVEDYLNSPKRPQASRYSNMLITIVEEMHLKYTDVCAVTGYLSYTYLPRLVCGVTKEQLRVLVEKYLYGPKGWPTTYTTDPDGARVYTMYEGVYWPGMLFENKDYAIEEVRVVGGGNCQESGQSSVVHTYEEYTALRHGRDRIEFRGTYKGVLTIVNVDYDQYYLRVEGNFDIFDDCLSQEGKS